MEQTRLESLKQLAQKDPANSFVRYGLAMEYAREGAHEEALRIFRELWEHNPDYAGAYYQAGQLLARMGRKEEARGILQTGIEVTTRTGDLHTKSELEAALADLSSADLSSNDLSNNEAQP